MKSEFVYKYRSGDKETFDRDLTSIEKNYFWGSNFNQLNDPCEILISSDKFKKLTKSFTLIFESRIKKNLHKVHKALDNVISKGKEIGIYSLSKTYNDELLWAHYANSHKGFCIEYDLELLLETYPIDKVYSFSVKYSKYPPEVELTDISDIDSMSIIKKLAGNKSERWKYEEEYRIVLDKSGKHPYNYNAFKGIYFGLRMDDSQKNEIMNRLKGRGIKYFQMKQLPGSYEFEKEPVTDINEDEITYLCQIPKSDKRPKPVNYRIVEKDFNKFFEKATITLELDSKVNENDLLWVAETIKDNLFWDAKRIIMFYKVKDQLDDGMAWATTNFKDGQFKVFINEFVRLK